MVVHAKQSLSEWLTPANLAQKLGVSESSVRRNIYTGSGPTPPGKIRGVKVGRQLRVHNSVYDGLTQKATRGNSGDSRRQPAGRRPSHFDDL